jgi:hypothetical protein
MRRVRAESDRVVRIGRGRATRYGLRREVPGLGRSEVPLFRIDSSGKPQPSGRLVVLAADEIVWLPEGFVFRGLPPEIDDMRPSGFIGRAFPGQHPDLSLPPRIQDWSNDHTLVALARRGEDFPGNLIVGDESLERWFQNRPGSVRRDRYPELAERATAGAPVGSSAGGEEPKFGAYVEGRHVLVKFAARGDSVATRWRDLLKLEQLALETLREGGVPAANASIVDTRSYRFLEVERFDRIGERGRRAMLSLAAVHQNPADSWAHAAARLLEERRISAEDARTLKLYEAFARWIGNVDRHHYNVVLFPTEAPSFYELGPAFDQLPMLYAPTGDGQLPEREVSRPAPTGDTWEVWERARSLASAFWRKARESEAISTSMRSVASAHLSKG